MGIFKEICETREISSRLAYLGMKKGWKKPYHAVG
jgi:hypothetical protein